MTNVLTRRGLVAVAAPAALFATVVPSSAGAPSAIKTLFAEHLRLEDIAHAAAVRSMDAEEHYEEPQRPLWHPLKSAGRHDIKRTSSGFVYVDLGEENVSYLRDHAADTCTTDENGFVIDLGERARKTLAEIEAWHSEVARRKDAIGATKLKAIEDEAYATANGCRDAILAIEATTFRELAFQAALFDDDWRQLAAERLLERLTELRALSRMASDEGGVHVRQSHAPPPCRCRSCCHHRERHAGPRRRAGP